VAPSADDRPSRRIVLVAAAFVVASMALFLLIAEDVLEGGGLVAHDEAVLNWFVDHRTAAWVNAARFVSTAGGFASLLVVGIAFGLLLLRREWHLAIAPVLCLLLAVLASTVTKAIFGRPRPPIVFHETHVASPAFPSGHATDAAAFFLAGAFVLALTVAHSRRIQLLYIGIGIVLAGLVGLSRLVLAVHWLSDVVAGWALGTAIAITVVIACWYAAAGRTRANSRVRASPSLDS
jgi:undecaprenyl-diphosphatase